MRWKLEERASRGHKTRCQCLAAKQGAIVTRKSHAEVAAQHSLLQTPRPEPRRSIGLYLSISPSDTHNHEPASAIPPCRRRSSAWARRPPGAAMLRLNPLRAGGVTTRRPPDTTTTGPPAGQQASQTCLPLFGGVPAGWDSAGSVNNCLPLAHLVANHQGSECTARASPPPSVQFPDASLQDGL